MAKRARWAVSRPTSGRPALRQTPTRSTRFQGRWATNASTTTQVGAPATTSVRASRVGSSSTRPPPRMPQSQNTRPSGKSPRQNSTTVRTPPPGAVWLKLSPITKEVLYDRLKGCYPALENTGVFGARKRSLFDTLRDTPNRQAPLRRPVRQNLDRGPRPGSRDPAQAPARVRRAPRLCGGRRVRRPCWRRRASASSMWCWSGATTASPARPGRWSTRSLSSRRAGWAFISYQENVDTTTPQGELVFEMTANLAQFESALIGERVRAGMARAKAQGKRTSRPPIPEATRRRIAELHGQGMSIKRIAKELGIAYGTAWNYSKGITARSL